MLIQTKAFGILRKGHCTIAELPFRKNDATGRLFVRGGWLSQSLFYIVGSLSILSIITIVLEIAFYAYFHWTQ